MEGKAGEGPRLFGKPRPKPACACNHSDNRHLLTPRPPCILAYCPCEPVAIQHSSRFTVFFPLNRNSNRNACFVLVVHIRTQYEIEGSPKKLSAMKETPDRRQLPLLGLTPVTDVELLDELLVLQARRWTRGTNGRPNKALGC